MHRHLLLLLVCTLTACGGSSSSSDFALPPADETSSTSDVEANVGPAGGTLATPEATLVVPPGAVSQNTVFGLSRRDGADLAFGATLRGGSVFRLEPAGETFDTPVVVTIPYDPATIVAPDTPNDLIALLQNTSTGQIERLTPSSVDTTAQTATYEVPHFSLIQNALLARILPQFTTFSADPDTGLAPNQTTTLTISLRNRALQELGGIEFGLTASGSGNTFGATTVTTDSNGQAQTTFTTSEGGTKTITASFNGTTVQTIDLVFGLPPVTSPDMGNTDEDSVLMGTDLLANDSDPDMDPLTAVAETVTSAMGATVTIASDGSYTYDPTGSMALNALPDAGNTSDTFTYQASDGNLTTPGTVTIAVSGLNDAPTPLADTGAASASTTLNGSGLLANDSDPDTGDVLSTVMESLTSTAGADVSIATDGTYSFDPTMVAAFIALPQGGTANDTFDYQASDGTASGSATVTVTVTGVNDAPTAVDDTGSTDEDTVLNGSNLTTNDTDPDTGTNLQTVAESVTSSMGASVVIAADGSYTYDPTSVLALNALAQGESAMDTFTYQVTDGALTDTGTVTVTVSGVNDAPTATADTGSTNEDTVLNGTDLLDNDSDPDTNDTLTTVMETVTSSMGASVSIATDGSYAYDPTGSMTLQALNMGDSVEDTFTYQLTDSIATVSTSVTVTVAGAVEFGLDLNGATAGLDASASFTEDGGAVTLVPDAFVSSLANVTSLGLTLDAAPDGDTLAATTGGTSITATYFASSNRLQLQGSDSAANYQTVLRSVTYDSTSNTPAASRTITVDLTDGALSASQTVTLAITPANDSPTADATSSSGLVDQPQTITLTGADLDGDSLTFAVASAPSDGSLGAISQLSPTSASVTYTPDMGFDGSDAFTFTVNDGTVTSAAATVSITVDVPVSVQGLARFEDTNQNQIADAGDTLIVPFNMNVSGGVLSDFVLSVTDDLFGTGASVMDGPAMNEQTITLGSGAVLKVREDVDPMDTDAGSPSGIDVAAMSGLADPSAPIDLTPGFASRLDVTGTSGGPMSASGRVVAVDFNDDGILDLAHGLNGMNQVIFFDASGMEGATQSSMTSDVTLDAAAGDLDRDGSVDVVFANDGQNRIFFNDGTGVIVPTDFGPGGDATTAVAVADVDRDGDLDILCGNNNQQDVIYLNDGSGNFGATANFGAGSDSSFDITLGDLDGDGDLDIVTANIGQCTLALNDGAGGFTGTTPLGAAGVFALSAAVGDLDGDGDLDIVVADIAQSVAYLNDGTGVAYTPMNLAAANRGHSEVALADLDRDGDLDVVLTSNGGNSDLLLNDGTGTAFTAAAGFPSLSINGMEVADFDRDGDPDLICAVDGQDTILLNSLLRQAPDLTASADFGAGTDNTVSVQVADVDRDGDLDLVVANFAAQNVVYLSDGASPPAFTSSVNFGTGTDSTYAVRVADVDGDGDLDLVAGNSGEQNAVYLNDGASPPSFTASVDFGPTTDFTQGLLVADVDGDGDLDLAVGNGGEQNVLYLNDGASPPSFAASVNFGPATDITLSLDAADVDGDGDLDLVVGNDREQNVVYLNDGASPPAFGTSVNFGSGTDESFVVYAADVDQDGDVDLAVGNFSAQAVLYLNDGASPPAFGSSVNLGGAMATVYSIQAADLDGDGDLDLAIGQTDENVVLFNDGASPPSFATSLAFDTSAGVSFSVSAADVDGDGDLDLVVGNALQQNVVYFND